jgi:NAD-dependent DNA ligase
MIRGVGPVYAKKLVRAFGENVFEVIETAPDRLREVDGIGPVRAASILAAWAEQKAVREIMIFLHSHGARDGALLVEFMKGQHDGMAQRSSGCDGWRPRHRPSDGAAPGATWRRRVRELCRACHEAPTRAVTRTSCSSATGSIDNSPGGFFLH